ncbi:hypothetical protein [Streptomyces sp. NPDC054874]
MAEAVLCDGLDPDDPDDPDAVTVVVVVSDVADHHERAAARLGSYGYEGENCLYLVQTDGWAERRLDGELLTVDIVAHPALLRGLEVDRERFTPGPPPTRRRRGCCGSRRPSIPGRTPGPRRSPSS